MRSSNLIRFALAATLVAGISLAAVYREQFSGPGLQAQMQNSGVAVPHAFMALYAATNMH